MLPRVVVILSTKQFNARLGSGHLNEPSYLQRHNAEVLKTVGYALLINTDDSSGRGIAALHQSTHTYNTGSLRTYTYTFTGIRVVFAVLKTVRY